jgi:two-component system sensor histidine kinase ComP
LITVPDAQNERYRIAAENSFDTIVLVDNNAVVQYVSPSLETLIGYTVEEYEGMDAFDVVHPDDRDRVRNSQQDAIRTRQPVQVEYRLIHRLGHVVYVETRVKPVIGEDGDIQYVVAVVRDVSERKKTEQLLQTILDNINAIVWSTDKDFKRMTFVSDNIEKMAGLSKQEYIENPFRLHDNMHPDDDYALRHEVKALLDAGVHVEKEIRMIHGGDTRWLRMIAHPHVDNSGEMEVRRIDGMLLDITDKKKAELALEESEQRYKSLFENNLDGVFSINVYGTVENVNASFERIVGRKANELIGHRLMNLVLAEDQPAVRKVLSHVKASKIPLDLECRIHHREGLRILSVTLVPILLSGVFNGVHGIVRDITERKQEERELIRSEERHRVLQQSINRLSADLASVMKVSELEQRLVNEVSNVLPVSNVSIEESAGEAGAARQNGDEFRLLIGRKKHPVYLRLTPREQMTKLEKEWLETVVHYATILYDNLQFIEDLMKQVEETMANNETPKWLLRLFFKLSEKERFALSSDLHDSVLQDLIIWYRRLESLRSRNSFPEFIGAELRQIEEGILDAIHQIRITCNELRPPFLLKMGLVGSLKSLINYTKMFANYEIVFSTDNFDCRLNEEQVLGLYRIVQELLNNASKHSQASKVTMNLFRSEQQICFTYSDDGVGFDVQSRQDSFRNMGISGIEKRVLSLEGEIQMTSSPNHGFHVQIKIPITAD